MRSASQAIRRRTSGDNSVPVAPGAQDITGAEVPIGSWLPAREDRVWRSSAAASAP